MRHVLTILALVLGVLATEDRVRAADPKEGHEKVTKVVMTGVDHKEKKLDLTKAEDLRELQEKLAAGEVEQVMAQKDVNILALRWETGLWTIVVFILLFLILRKLAWGPMLEGLKKREDNIQAALVEAKEARAEARALKDELQAERNQAAEKVAEMMAEARRDAEYTRNEMLAKGKAEIQTERERALREIGMAKDQALHELLNQQAELTILAASKAINKVLDGTEHRRLVDEALADLRKSAQTGNGKV